MRATLTQVGRQGYPSWATRLPKWVPRAPLWTIAHTGVTLTHMDKNAAAEQPLCAVLREVMDTKNLTEHGLARRTGIASTTLQRRFTSGTFTLNELEAIGKVL